MHTIGAPITVVALSVTLCCPGDGNCISQIFGNLGLNRVPRILVNSCALATQSMFVRGLKIVSTFSNRGSLCFS